MQRPRLEIIMSWCSAALLLSGRATFMIQYRFEICRLQHGIE